MSLAYFDNLNSLIVATLLCLVVLPEPELGGMESERKLPKTGDVELTGGCTIVKVISGYCDGVLEWCVSIGIGGGGSVVAILLRYFLIFHYLTFGSTAFVIRNLYYRFQF